MHWLNSRWVYLGTLGLFAIGMGAGAFMNLMRAPELAANVLRLGYPAYFMTILGVGQAIGLLTLICPAPRTAKEWAHAGFAINLISAFVSHLAVGDSFAVAVAPLMMLLIQLVSYTSWKCRATG